jgi:two-component system sensor histidine kinase RegB
MAGGAGNTAAESIESVAIADLLADATTGLRDRPPVSLELDGAAGDEVVEVPPRALAQAIRNLLTNAQDASAGDEPVALQARRRGPALEIEVRDRGGGMTEAILARIGEPFFTTKEPGKGMGLGLFLTRAVIEGLGGSLAIDSRPGAGTRVVATIPANPRQPADHPRSTDASVSAVHPDR